MTENKLTLIKDLADDWYDCDDLIGSNYYEHLIKEMINGEEEKVIRKLRTSFGDTEERSGADSKPKGDSAKFSWGYYD